MLLCMQRGRVHGLCDYINPRSMIGSRVQRRLGYWNSSDIGMRVPLPCVAIELSDLDLVGYVGATGDLIFSMH
jgi:hypothetical protein